MARFRPSALVLCALIVALGLSNVSLAQAPASPPKSEVGTQAVSRPLFDATALRPQQRVRFKTATAIAGHPGGRWIEGSVVGIEPDTLELAIDRGGLVRIPNSSIDDLEVSNGRSRLDGAVIGLGVAALTGLALGLYDDANCRPGFLNFCGNSKFLAPLTLAPIGALVGAIIGKQSWVRPPVANMKVGAAPAPGGFRIVGTVTF